MDDDRGTAAAHPTPGTRWLDDRERAAWVGLASVVELLPGVLERQLRRDAGLTHFEYVCLATLEAAPGRTIRMSGLAASTNATLPRLSHVVRRLEERGLVVRAPSPEDARATDATLTEAGLALVREAAPDHVATVRSHVLDGLTHDQVDQLAAITAAVLERIDPGAEVAASLRVPPT